ncbi:hypothetical protein V1281_004423 [Nitrobacteraceae bacterium AZCC 2161]
MKSCRNLRVLELATFLEQLVCMADIGFRLLHGRHVQKHERLPQIMIGAEGPDRGRRTADDRTSDAEM